MIALRLDTRLRGPVDPSDVLQEATIQAARALPSYLERPDRPFYLWLRLITGVTSGWRRSRRPERRRPTGPRRPAEPDPTGWAPGSSRSVASDPAAGRSSGEAVQTDRSSPAGWA
jgi:DNA-directed RNA polymerase specialized sigma24 family protein